ncbi:Ppx/GppA phosphatase family-domain-containing protein [Dichotomocladium elegans]|nr:Ppx/GppA phosphatase family-domain-containing protein [Dichotomocladium elegans]
MTTVPNEAPFAVVDMGSNGIRFGIVSALARHLPVSYEERAPISLFDAQGSDRVIPEETIAEVITTFRRYKMLCAQAGVAPENVKVIATEATRLAANGQDFMSRIHEATGWTVRLLSKEEEALISAAGIVGTFYRVNGLTMDLGGGSFELSYVHDKDGSINRSEAPVSLPFGAAALKRRLEECETDADRKALYDAIVASIRTSLEQIKVPASLAAENDGQDGYTIYMSGGGFRALGYLSMNAENSVSSDRQFTSYVLPIISGYCISGKELSRLAKKHKDTPVCKAVKALTGFRVSKRRASMLPAVCFLVSAMMQVIPIHRVFFSEGGVRQGLCYTLLSLEEQRKDPLLEGVKAHAARSSYALSSSEFEATLAILTTAIPAAYLDPKHPLQLHRLLPVAIHLANLTTHYPKETRAYVSFHMPLANGALANIPGVSHTERCALALLLTYRQGGQVPDRFFRTVQKMLGRHEVALCRYVGRLMELVFSISPLNPGCGMLESGISFSVEQRVLDDPLYPATHLTIRLCPTVSPLAEAPAIKAIMENLCDTKANAAATSNTLFSITIERSTVEKE